MQPHGAGPAHALERGGQPLQQAAELHGAGPGPLLPLALRPFLGDGAGAVHPPLLPRPPLLQHAVRRAARLAATLATCC